MRERIILGGYTGKGNKGIASIYLNREKNCLEEYRLLQEVERPTYLISEGDIIYSCAQNGEKSGMARLRSDGIDSTIWSDGKAPCHISKSGDRIFLSYYHQGELAIIRETQEGFLEERRIRHSGRSIHPNQDSAHIHFSQIIPGENVLWVCDLGMDAVIGYELGGEGWKEKFRFSTPAGFGPRHLCFHPSMSWIYVIGELSNQILCLEYRQGFGLEQKQIISTLSPEFKGESAAAAIRISRDGKFLYASNRGEDSIAIYQIEGGILRYITSVSTEGSGPRDFSLNPAEDYLVAANLNSDSLTLWKRNLETGTLTLCQKGVSAPECCCINFINKK